MQAAKPTISAVIPAYNEETSIAACLDSLLNQTESFYEIIVVDNNSTDDTVKIVKEYQKNYPKIIRVLKESKQRPIYARNRGFNAAKGEILARFDVDSRLEPDWVAGAQKVFTNPEIMAASGNSSFYDTPGQSQQFSSWVHWLIVHRINKFLIGGPMLIGSNTAIRRGAWRQVKSHLCERRDIFEDVDLAIHCSQLGLKAVYEENLRNWVSPRRYATPLRSISKYLRKWPRTFFAHRYPYATALAFIAVPLVIIFTYLPTYLMLRAYNPATERFSLRRFLEFNSYD